MGLAFADRSKSKDHSTTHYTMHAPACIVLLTTSLDAWINETLSRMRFGGEDPAPIAREPTPKKCRSFLDHFGAAHPPSLVDLDLAFEVRDEIVHYLPRGLPATRNLPPWLAALEQRNLLLSTRIEQIEYGLSDRLCSYALAYWVWVVVADAAVVLESAIPETRRFLARPSSNFRFPPGVLPPRQFIR